MVKRVLLLQRAVLLKQHDKNKNKRSKNVWSYKD